MPNPKPRPLHVLADPLADNELFAFFRDIARGDVATGVTFVITTSLDGFAFGLEIYNEGERIGAEKINMRHLFERWTVALATEKLKELRPDADHVDD